MNILYNVDALLMVKQSDIICSPCIFRFWGAPNTFFSVSSYAQGICALFSAAVTCISTISAGDFNTCQLSDLYMHCTCATKRYVKYRWKYNCTQGLIHTMPHQITRVAGSATWQIMSA